MVVPQGQGTQEPPVKRRLEPAIRRERGALQVPAAPRESRYQYWYGQELWTMVFQMRRIILVAVTNMQGRGGAEGLSYMWVEDLKGWLLEAT